MRAAAPAAPDLNLLAVLDAVLQERSVQRAAIRLAITPSAVSHSLRRLREIAGDPLLIRTPRGMVPTALADRLAAKLRRAIVDLAGILEDEERFEPTTARRTFTISSADLAQFVILPSLERRLAAEAPGIRLVVRPPRGDLTEALASGALDLAFSVPGDAPEGFRSQVLFRDGFVCVLRKGHPAAGEAMTLERYLALTHLVVAPRGGPGSMVDSALAALGHRREVALVVPHFLMAPLIVAETDLVLTFPSRLARRYAELLPLVLSPTPLALAPFAVGQIWHDRAQHDPAHAWLRRAIAESGRSAGPDEDGDERARVDR